MLSAINLKHKFHFLAVLDSADVPAFFLGLARLIAKKANEVPEFASRGHVCCRTLVAFCCCLQHNACGYGIFSRNASFHLFEISQNEHLTPDR